MNEAEKTIKAIDITLIALEHDKDQWLKDFLVDIKSTLQSQQKEIKFWKDIAESCECNN